VAQALRPYPQYQAIAQTGATTGFTTYNALQLNVQKRFRHGLSFLLAYTAAKNLGNANYGNQGHNDHRKLAKQLLAVDRPQSLAISYTYDLPFGPDKRFLKSANPFVKQVVSGWQVAGMHSYMSMPPVSVFTTQSIPGGVGGIWAFSVPGVARTQVSCGDYDPRDPSRNQFLNINAFRTPPPFTFGDTFQLSSTRPCGYLNENLAVLKTFSITERVGVKFGAFFFNLLNRHQWIGLATNIGVPGSFGRYSGAWDPRTVQLNLKVQF
jgi:hypothetical protein